MRNEGFLNSVAFAPCVVMEAVEVLPDARELETLRNPVILKGIDTSRPGSRGFVRRRLKVAERRAAKKKMPQSAAGD